MAAKRGLGPVRRLERLDVGGGQPIIRRAAEDVHGAGGARGALVLRARRADDQVGDVVTVDVARRQRCAELADRSRALDLARRKRRPARGEPGAGGVVEDGDHAPPRHPDREVGVAVVVEVAAGQRRAVAVASARGRHAGGGGADCQGGHVVAGARMEDDRPGARGPVGRRAFRRAEDDRLTVVGAEVVRVRRGGHRAAAAVVVVRAREHDDRDDDGHECRGSGDDGHARPARKRPPRRPGRRGRGRDARGGAGRLLGRGRRRRLRRGRRRRLRRGRWRRPWRGFRRSRGQRAAREHGLRGLRDAPAVVIREPLERLARDRSELRARRHRQARELADRALADARKAAPRGRLEVGRKRRSAGAAGNHDVTAHGAAHARRLVRRPVAHLLLHIVVEVVDRDRAVAVRVGLAAPQALDEAAREQRAGLRGAELVDAGGVRLLERVLELIRGGQGHAAVPVEAMLDPGRERALGHEPLAERAAVTAVEQHDDRAGAALVHRLVDEAVVDGGRSHPLQLGARRREVEAPVLREDAVAREVEEQEVLPAALAEEVLDPLLDRVGGLIDQPLDLEAADRLVPEHLGERLDIARRRAQRRQPWIDVGGAGDQQSAPSARGYVIRRHDGQGRSRATAAARRPRPRRASAGRHRSRA